MLCLSGFELYSRWVPLNLFLFLIQSDKCNLHFKESLSKHKIKNTENLTFLYLNFGN